MAKLTQNVIVHKDNGGDPVLLEAGSEAPAWALSQLGEHVLDTPPLPDASDGYDKLTAKDLKVLIAARNAERDEADAIVPDSTRKDDLIVALELDDDVVEGEDESGEED